MSKRRRKTRSPQQPPRPLARSQIDRGSERSVAGQHKPQVRNTHAERPSLNITIKMLPDGRMEVDPKYNDAAMEHLDVLYAAANREDFRPEFTDDHKIAFFIADMMAGFLAQWETPDSAEGGDEDGGAIPGVPHIKESPVVDRYDIADMKPARSGGQRE